MFTVTVILTYKYLSIPNVLIYVEAISAVCSVVLGHSGVYRRETE